MNGIDRRRMLLPLGYDSESRLWHGEPSRIFRPEGLLIEHAPDGAMLHGWMTGPTIDLPLGYRPMRLSVFERFEQALSEGRRHPASPSFRVLETGMLLRLDVRTASGEPITPEQFPRFSLTVWGITA